MGKILSFIPGFRSRTPRHMALAGVYYLFSVSMMLANVALGFLLLSGPFLIFHGHAAIERYAESKNARALIALFVSAAICGGSLIGFVMDMAVREEDTPGKVVAFMDTVPIPAIPAASAAPVPVQSPSPSPLGPFMEQAVVLEYTEDGIHMQFADESAGDINLGGIRIDDAMDAIDYMQETIPPGSIVYLEKDTGGADYYVWMEEPLAIDPGEVCGKTLNALLVANGYAMVSDNREGKYTDILTLCEEEASAACVGLWVAAMETAATVTPVANTCPNNHPDTRTDNTYACPVSLTGDRAAP